MKTDFYFSTRKNCNVGAAANLPTANVAAADLPVTSILTATSDFFPSYI